MLLAFHDLYWCCLNIISLSILHKKIIQRNGTLYSKTTGFQARISGLKWFCWELFLSKISLSALKTFVLFVLRHKLPTQIVLAGDRTHPLSALGQLQRSRFRHHTYKWVTNVNTVFHSYKDKATRERLHRIIRIIEQTNRYIFLL